MGFSTGLTVAILSSIDIWLALNGTSKTVIGLFVLCKLPYTFKFIFVPFTENHSIFRGIGIRKGWVIFAHFGIFFSIIAIASSSPLNTVWVFILSLMLMFANAIQNITSYNFQVDRVKEVDLGITSSMVTFGYRVGILAATAGVLLLAHYYGWKRAFISYGLLSLTSSVIFLFRKEPLKSKFMVEGKRIAKKFFNQKNIGGFRKIFVRNFLIPLRATYDRSGFLIAMLLLAIIKIPDDMAHKMARLMYIEIGFNVKDIAHYVNNLGFLATIIGGILSGFFMKKISIQKTLHVSGLLHALTFLCYIFVWKSGVDRVVFASAIVMENLTGGMLMSAFIAKLYSLSAQAKSPAFMYAFLWCLYNIVSLSSVSVSGVIASNFGWDNFFLITMSIALVGVLCSVFYEYKRKNE